MNNQEQSNLWEEVKFIWDQDSKETAIHYKISTLIEELKSKSSAFEKKAIHADTTKIKSAWTQYKTNISQFEKETIKRDLSFIKKCLTKLKHFFKIKK